MQLWFDSIVLAEGDSIRRDSSSIRTRSIDLEISNYRSLILKHYHLQRRKRRKFKNHKKDAVSAIPKER